ncbi:MAG: NAD(P)-dependent oxidoreductase [Ideonella sp.]|jgi:nucleoside-diphosphate-sugar epimerase|nr:NAD(P)-dependent oxidoreductase [Ideonella sp.]
MLTAPANGAASTVLVTGAGGFLGQHVVRALREAGFGVRAMARTVPVERSQDTPNVQWVEADLLASDLAPVVRGVAAVVHLAAVLRGDDQAQWTAAVDGTRRLIEAMPTGARLVLASSFSVYDWDRAGAEVDERSPLLDIATGARVAGYARAKLAQEHLATALCRERALELVILRPATVWDESGHGIDHAGVGAGPLLAVVDPGRNVQAIHVVDCADAFVRALTHASPGAVYNVVDPTPVSAWTYAGRVAPGRWRVPVPRGWLSAAAALAVRLRSAGPDGAPRLPGLLVPQRLAARFPRALARADRAQQALGWSPRAVVDSRSGHRRHGGSA